MSHARSLWGFSRCPADLTRVGSWLSAGMGPGTSAPAEGTCGHAAQCFRVLLLLPKAHFGSDVGPQVP